MRNNKAVPKANKPMSASEFARLLRRLPEHLPITDAYESKDGPGEVWYSSQREHTVGWFSELAGPGAYNRKSRGLDAKHGYNHSQCPPALLWIAEALGEDAETLTAATAAAATPGRLASQCAAIRKVIPWARIEELVRRRRRSGRRRRL